MRPKNYKNIPSFYDVKIYINCLIFKKKLFEKKSYMNFKINQLSDRTKTQVLKILVFVYFISVYNLFLLFSKIKRNEKECFSNIYGLHDLQRPLKKG